MIQSRYGWTDEVVRNLLFPRFEQLINLLSKIKWEDTRDNFVLAAFIGWQTRSGEDKVTFGNYLNRLGLSDEHSQEPSRNADPRSMKAENEKLSHMGIKVKKMKE